MSWKFNPFTGTLDRDTAGSSDSSLNEFSDLVPSGQTRTVFSSDYSNKFASKIWFSMVNQLNSKFKAWDITAVRKDADIAESVSVVGNFSAAVLIRITAGNIEMDVSNNESFDASVNGYRLDF